MKKSELRQLIKEEILKESSELTTLENNMFMSIIKYGVQLTKENPEARNEFFNLKKKFENDFIKLQNKFNI